MTRYAAETQVSSEQSRLEIERTLTRYGADAFAYATENGRAAIRFRCNEKWVAFVLPLPDRNAAEFSSYYRGSYVHYRSESQQQHLYEQAIRQRWRALALVIKAKLEAVETGITTFEDEFLAHLLLPDGSTFGEWAKPQIEQAYLDGKMPASVPLLTGGVG